MLERIRRARRDDSGFTLIELLIVIVILGILAAIVVFAVNGIQNRGVQAACKADVETVTVAAEAYDAQNGHYAKSMDELVQAGLLHSVPSSTNYTIDYQPNGNSVNVSSTTCPNDNASGSSSNSSSSSSNSDQRAAYCTLLQSFENNQGGLDDSQLADDRYTALIKAFNHLAQQAPVDAIAHDWQAVSDALSQVQQILNQAGLTWNDLGDAENGNLPDMTQQDAAALTQQIDDAISNGNLDSAFSEISQDASNNCDMNLGG
jgi:prepilin-type N-terminal cleavage/methylation domain-containing protein